MNQNLYEILGLPSNATQGEIKRAYKRLARIFHPDINQQEGSEEIFKEITYAYSVLSDTRKRIVYDSGLAKENLIGRIEMLRPLLRSLIRFNIKESRDELIRLIARYNTVIVDVRLEEGEIVRDTEKIAPVSAMEMCPDCLGYNVSCRRCSGSGRIPVEKRIRVRIPAYSFFKESLNLPVKVDTYSGRKRLMVRLSSKGRNISINRQGVFFQLLTSKGGRGGRINVEIMGRMLEVNIPENIEPDTVLRLRKWFDNHDINIKIKPLFKENTGCVV